MYIRWRRRQGRGLENRASLDGSIAKSKSTDSAAWDRELACCQPASSLAGGFAFPVAKAFSENDLDYPANPEIS
jgi:hypothetical protein